MSDASLPMMPGAKHPSLRILDDLNTGNMTMQDVEIRKTGKLQLVLAWSIAGIPLLAGVTQTFVNAMKLFQ